jgi:hypothetical protein
MGRPASAEKQGLFLLRGDTKLGNNGRTLVGLSDFGGISIFNHTRAHTLWGVKVYG